MPDASRPPSAPGTPPESDRVRDAFDTLCRTIARLRAPDGCPWDRVQTLKSIRPFTLEETHELLEAIDADDTLAIREELGDVLLQVVLDSQIAADEGRFDIIAVIEDLTAKMIRRHPHVFGTAEAHTAADVADALGSGKTQKRSHTRRSSTASPPRCRPSSDVCGCRRRPPVPATTGPTGPCCSDSWREELAELQAELYPDGEIPAVAAGVSTPVVADELIDDPVRLDHIEEELGDLLFVVASIARRWG
ncbi:MAG: MazG nucleotide pyrophosphohydrolase domain-containing protein [Planctomycetaceae bacterium]